MTRVHTETWLHDDTVLVSITDEIPASAVEDVTDQIMSLLGKYASWSFKATDGDRIILRVDAVKYIRLVVEDDEVAS